LPTAIIAYRENRRTAGEPALGSPLFLRREKP
jgi:hypothetical protein